MIALIPVEVAGYSVDVSSSRIYRIAIFRNPAWRSVVNRGANQDPEDLALSDYQALAEIRHAIRQFTSFSKKAAEAAGLPPQQHQALLAIIGSPGGGPVTVGMVAERLFIAPHSATELVGRLSEAGLVTRTEDPDDRRRQVIKVTPKATRLLRTLSASHLRELRSLAPDLIRLLKKLNPR